MVDASRSNRLETLNNIHIYKFSLLLALTRFLKAELSCALQEMLIIVFRVSFEEVSKKH